MKIKNKKILLIFLAIFIAVGFLTAHQVLAQFTYTPMEQIPGTSSATTLPAYIQAIYKFGIWTVGIAALLMIMIGGFMYISSAGNNASMQKAKGIITDAIIGIIMAMTAWLVLHEINPALVNVQLDMPPVLTGSSSSTGGGTGTATNAQLTQQLNNCNQWCTSNAANANTTEGQAWNSSCATGCQQDYTNATQAAQNGQSMAQIQQNQQDCQTYCAAGGSDASVDYNTCYNQCMAAKASQVAQNQNQTSGGAGNGTCSSPADSANSCNAANLSGSCFGSNAQQAASICNVESQGLATAKGDKTTSGDPVSIGLFQINLTVHNVAGLNCPSAFSGGYSGSNHNITIVNQSLYNQCVAAAQDPATNIATACSISNNGSRWGQWSANSQCGFNN